MTIAGMRSRILLGLTVAGLIVLTATTTHSAAGGGAPPAPLVWRLHEVDTSVVPVDNPPKGTSAGDLLVFTAAVSSGGQPVGRYVGNCTYVTKTEIFCSIDFNVYGQGRIEFAGELSTQEPDAVFPVTGGSGRYALARGYLTNHQTTTGTSADEVLYLYWT